MKSNLAKPLPSIWEIIDRIQHTLGLEDSFLAEILSWTPPQFTRNKLALKPLTIFQVEQLARAFQLSLENLITGTIDYRALAQHHAGNKTHLPEKYQTCALGKRRSNLVILNFIESFFGWRERAAVLRHFQMNEAMFANPDAPISIAFGADLLDYLVRYRLDRSIIPKIGTNSFLSTAPAAVKHELVAVKSAREIYERMCDHIVGKYFEKNYVYQIQKMDTSTCTVIAKPNKPLLDQLKTNGPLKPETEMVRIGIASAYPQLIQLPEANVKQTASIFQGDASIRYEINFEHAQAVLERRMQSRIRDHFGLLN